MATPIQQSEIQPRRAGDAVWLTRTTTGSTVADLPTYPLHYEVLESEEAVGHEMLRELKAVAESKQGPVVMILLGGRGAQALHRILGQAAEGTELDWLLSRLNVFTQDALAPLRMDNGLSFVRDFERLLGERFFAKVQSFTCMRTDAADLEAELVRYVSQLESLGGIDIFFLGLGPEAQAASHLAYIKPNAGARVDDVAGKIPISESILEHHIRKFKAGGTVVTPEDESECRAATHILTLGPAAILGARRIVQSIVDASTAPGKRESYKRVLETGLSNEQSAREKQLDENPGLWLRLHPNVRSLVLADVV